MMPTTQPTQTPTATTFPARVEVVIVGGGPAGLQAALTLGRMHRDVLLVDSGDYRNAPAAHLHNFLTHDGTPPSEFRARARADLAAYSTVGVWEGTVSDIEGSAGQWSVQIDGAYAVQAGAIILATGMHDTLPATPGLSELWGGAVAACPFCHGHEFSGRPVGLLGVGPQTLHLVGMLSAIASTLTVLTDGSPAEADLADQLAGAGVDVVTGSVQRVEAGGLGAVAHLEDGSSVDLAGLFVTTTATQSAPFAEQLGLTMLPSGCIEVDEFGATNVPGVFAAGDLAHRGTLPGAMPSVLSAAAAGMVTAAGLAGQLGAQSLTARAESEGLATRD